MMYAAGRGAKEINVLDNIVGLSSEMRHRLRGIELARILRDFVGGFRYREFKLDGSEPLVMRAFEDLEQSAEEIVNRQYERSRWASLQAAEKILKATLSTRNIQIPRSHDLKKVSALVESNVGVSIPRRWLAMAQCEPDIRYEDGATLRGSVAAHRAALRIAARVARLV
jgi:HEPN domain-containing protein